jgi:hypothetical protein
MRARGGDFLLGEQAQNAFQDSREAALRRLPGRAQSGGRKNVIRISSHRSTGQP